MAKLEIQDVYRFIPIHLEERPFLGRPCLYRLPAPLQPFPPVSPLALRVLLRGIWRVQAQRTPARVRLPITASLMWQIKAHLALPSPSFLKVFIWAACSLGFCGFLHSGEFLLPDGAHGRWVSWCSWQVGVMVLMAGGCHGAHGRWVSWCS